MAEMGEQKAGKPSSELISQQVAQRLSNQLDIRCAAGSLQEYKNGNKNVGYFTSCVPSFLSFGC